MDTGEFILHESKRGDVYRLLSACFYFPNKKLFLEEGLFENLSMLLNTVSPDAAFFSAKMGQAIHQYTEEELAVEYSKLFVGPWELKAPPYGSIYLDKERRVMGDSTMEVIRMYQEARLIMDKDFKELPDHIAVELEFMHFLTYEMVDALGKSESDRAQSLQVTRNLFLNQYLRRWVPEFCNKINTNTDNAFYGALADCVSTFLSQLPEPEDFGCFPGGKPCGLSMS